MRADVSPEDLLRALIGMCYMHDQPGWQASVLRLVDVFVDGLRLRPARPRTKTPRKPPRPETTKTTETTKTKQRKSK